MKDWIVSTKQIKKGKSGLKDWFRYMLNEEKPSHKYSQITNIGNEHAYSNILSEIDERKEKRQAEGLPGGGVNCLATSFMLNIPHDLHHPSTEEWKKIGDETLKNFVENFNKAQENKQNNEKTDQELIDAWQEKREKAKEGPFSEEEIEKKLARRRKEDALYNSQRLDLDKVRKNCALIIHDESESLEDNTNKSSHLNVMISNVFDGEVVKAISQYTGTHKMKMAYNKAIKDVLGYDNRRYTPEEDRVPGQAPYQAEDFKQAKIDNEEEKIEKKKKRRRRRTSTHDARKKTLIDKEKAIKDKEIEVLHQQAITEDKAREDLKRLTKIIEKENGLEEKKEIIKKKLEEKNETINKKRRILKRETAGLKKRHETIKKNIAKQKSKIENSKEEILNFNDNLFEYIERKQENNKKDNQYSVEDNETKVFFESKLEASIYINDTYDIDMEDTEKYIQPNYFEKIKNWLSNAFVKIYSNFSDEDFDKRFNQINKIIENQTNDKENKLENKRRNNRRP